MKIICIVKKVGLLYQKQCILIIQSPNFQQCFLNIKNKSTSTVQLYNCILLQISGIFCKQKII